MCVIQCAPCRRLQGSRRRMPRKAQHKTKTKKNTLATCRGYGKGTLETSRGRGKGTFFAGQLPSCKKSPARRKAAARWKKGNPCDLLLLVGGVRVLSLIPNLISIVGCLFVGRPQNGVPFDVSFRPPKKKKRYPPKREPRSVGSFFKGPGRSPSTKNMGGSHKCAGPMLSGCFPFCEVHDSTMCGI